MPADITHKIIEVIGAVRASKHAINHEASLDELGIDELDRLELIMRLEDQFKVCIDDEQFGNLDSVDQVTQYISSLNK